MIRRVLLGLLLLCVQLVAHAYAPTTGTVVYTVEPVYGGTSWPTGGPYTTAVSACTSATTQWDAQLTNSKLTFNSVNGTPSGTRTNSYTFANAWCNISSTNNDGSGGQTANARIHWANGGPMCPNGGTLTNGQCVCPAGEIDTGSACQPSPCVAGSTTTLNPTTGYGWVTRFEDGLAIVKGAPGRVSGDGNTAPASLCDGQCSVTATGPASEFWVSKDPGATGMHRISVVQTYTRTGTTCSVKSSDLDTTITANCPGTMGSMNGKPVCLSTSTTENGSGGGSSLQPGTNIGNNPAPGGSGEKVGGDGQLGGGGTPPSNAGGGSTPGTPGGVVTSGGSTVRVVTRSDGTTETEEVKWGEVKEGKADGVPKIYTRKYDKSPGDYFNEKITAVSGAGGRFITAAFSPPWSDNPALCPKWSLPSGSIGPWELGLGDVSVPCNVWAFCRIVIILSALFLARALVFGG